MNPSSADARFKRLESFLTQDPHNLVLLADAAASAISAGAFSRADEMVELGLQLSANDAGWTFRQATLRIAQRRQEEARAVLGSLAGLQVSHAAVVHNLAYIEFLEGNYAGSAALLKPLLEGATDAGDSPQEPQAQALWLRALHRMGAMQEAWTWTQERLRAGQLSANAAGVASLIALDLSHVEAAASLASQALDAGVRELEPLVARSGAALVSRDTKLARDLLQEALQLSPDDARTWGSLGLAAMLDQRFADARLAFQNALKTHPHAEFLQGLGWACVMTDDLPTAAKALDEAIGMDDSDAESHGARAVVYALKKDVIRAQACIDRASSLSASSQTAQLAKAIIDDKSADARTLLKAARLA
ncbi:MAG: hypothetical protein H7255_16595 [Ramlibacter sp.]|nr:hypothetical protein [Ramlibacter sp.]